MSGRGPEEERDRLFRATTGLLGEVATERPVMVVLDDRHAGDAAPCQLSHLRRPARDMGSGWRHLANRDGGARAPSHHARDGTPSQIFSATSVRCAKTTTFDS
ncbi:hypothetical protein GCM10010272_18850 [Streptomyces lateritius]|nr:hypothetical protein GCM10010272_18850 [Streptomyces lateritius]